MKIRAIQEGEEKLVQTATNNTLKHHSEFDSFYQEIDDFDKPPTIKDLACVAENDGGQIVGVINGRVVLDPSDRSFPFAQIQNIWVAEEERGNGVARALHDEFIQEVQKSGIKAVEIHVDIRNEAGLKFWDSLPYETYQERRRKLLD